VVAPITSCATSRQITSSITFFQIVLFICALLVIPSADGKFWLTSSARPLSFGRPKKSSRD
jgi:hypothetical protein